jgi:hypothetical protein
MAKGFSNFYDQDKGEKYINWIYYSILLVTGNDIAPSVQSEFRFCSFILFIGAFVEAYIIGGITAEMIKTQDKNVVFSKNLEYVKFSLERLNFPDLYQN